MCRSEGNRILRILKLKCLTSCNILGQPTLRRSQGNKRNGAGGWPDVCPWEFSSPMGKSRPSRTQSDFDPDTQNQTQVRSTLGIRAILRGRVWADFPRRDGKDRNKLKQLSQTLMCLEHIKIADSPYPNFPRPNISRESDSVGGPLRGFCGSGPRTTLAFNTGGRTTHQMVEQLPRAQGATEDFVRTDGLAGATNHSHKK